MRVIVTFSEANKAVDRRDKHTVSLFDMLAPPPAPAPTPAKASTPPALAPQAFLPGDASHGGKLHKETRIDTRGHSQGRWVAPAEAPAPPPVHSWPLTHPPREHVAEMARWLESAPEGAKIKAGETALVKRGDKANRWRISGSKVTVASTVLAEQLGPPLPPDEDGEDRNWTRDARSPSPTDLEGAITAEHPGEGHIDVADPTISIEIPQMYLGRLNANIEKLQAKAAKLGLPPLTVAMSDVWTKVVTVGNPPDVLTRHVPAVTVMVTMPEIKLPGEWQLVGTVEHGEHGNKIHLQRRPRGLNAIAARTRANTCDHCRTVRDRKQTIILENEDGDIKHVGGECAKEYLGHNVPISGWDDIHRQMMDELYGVADDAWGEGSVRHNAGVPTDRFMDVVAALVRRYGYKPRVNDRGALGTADEAWEVLVAKPLPGIDRMQFVEQGDKEHAARVLEWVRSIPPNIESDFLHNLRMSLAGESVTPRDIGMGAAAFNAWERAHKATRPDVKAGGGGFTGAVGDKIGTGKAHQIRPISGTVVQYTPIDGPYSSFLVKILGDDGNMYSSFMSNPRFTNAEHVENLDSFGFIPRPPHGARNSSGSAHPGNRVLITSGSVKKHDTYRGEKSTVLERMKYERTDIPNTSPARTGQAGRFSEEHDLEYLEWARHHAEQAGHKLGTEDFNRAFHEGLLEATRRWPHDIGGGHWEGVNGLGYSEHAAGRDARPVTEIARANQAAYEAGNAEALKGLPSALQWVSTPARD